jgi:hypothetical protein
MADWAARSRAHWVDAQVDVKVEGGKTALANERGHETRAMSRCRNGNDKYSKHSTNLTLQP